MRASQASIRGEPLLFWPDLRICSYLYENGALHTKCLMICLEANEINKTYMYNILHLMTMVMVDCYDFLGKEDREWVIWEEAGRWVDALEKFASPHFDTNMNPTFWLTFQFNSVKIF